MILNHDLQINSLISSIGDIFFESTPFVSESYSFSKDIISIVFDLS